MPETNRIAEASHNSSREQNGSSEKDESLSGMLPELPESCQKAGQAVKQYVEENPVIATAVTFGVGLGMGMLATSMLKSSSVAPPNMASRIGQMMLDKASNVLPDSLVDRFNG